MTNRQERRKAAEDTLEILEKGYFINAKGENIEIKDLQDKAELQTKVYSPEESDKLINNKEFETVNGSTKIKVTNQTTLDAVRDLISEGDENVICLNFASAKNPGGGFLGGSQAQEESIARSTGLYNIAKLILKVIMKPIGKQNPVSIQIT